MGAWVLASALRVALSVTSGESLARWFWIIFLQVCRWEKRWTVESFLQGDVDAVMKGVDMNSLVRVSCRVTSVQS